MSHLTWLFHSMTVSKILQEYCLLDFQHIFSQSHKAVCKSAGNLMLLQSFVFNLMLCSHFLIN